MNKFSFWQFQNNQEAQWINIVILRITFIYFCASLHLFFFSCNFYQFFCSFCTLLLSQFPLYCENPLGSWTSGPNFFTNVDLMNFLKAKYWPRVEEEVCVFLIIITTDYQFTYRKSALKTQPLVIGMDSNPPMWKLSDFSKNWSPYFSDGFQPFQAFLYLLSILFLMVYNSNYHFEMSEI